MPTTTPARPLTIKPMPDDWAYLGRLDEPVTQSTARVYVILDVAERELSTLVHTRGDSYDMLPGNHHTWPRLPAPGGRTASFSFLTVPRRMSFITPLRAREDVHAFLETVATPLAQEILAGLIPVPGTDDVDWTAAALHAADELRFICDYPTGVPEANRQGVSVEQQRRESRDGVYVDAARLFAVRPDLVDKTWAGMDDERLNSRAETLLRFLLGAQTRKHGEEDLYGQLGTNRDGDGQWPGVRLVGMRAFMYAYRQRAAADLTVQSANRWYTQPQYAARITAELSDAEIAALAEEHTTVARCEGLLLVGAADAIRARRAAARRTLRDQLPVVGDAHAAAKAVLDQAQQRRSALVARVIAWGVPADTDAELGRLARMSHTGVAKLREKLTNPDGAGVEQ